MKNNYNDLLDLRWNIEDPLTIVNAKSFMAQHIQSHFPEFQLNKVKLFIIIMVSLLIIPDVIIIVR
jgi:hypothetical protein